MTPSHWRYSFDDVCSELRKLTGEAGLVRGAWLLFPSVFGHGEIAVKDGGEEAPYHYVGCTQQEMAEMIGGKLQLNALSIRLLRHRKNTRIVDKHVEVAVPGLKFARKRAD